jgi:hypothetical protein
MCAWQQQLFSSGMCMCVSCVIVCEAEQLSSWQLCSRTTLATRCGPLLVVSTQWHQQALVVLVCVSRVVCAVLLGTGDRAAAAAYHRPAWAPQLADWRGPLGSLHWVTQGEGAGGWSHPACVVRLAPSAADISAGTWQHLQEVFGQGAVMRPAGVWLKQVAHMCMVDWTESGAGSAACVVKDVRCDS